MMKSMSAMFDRSVERRNNAWAPGKNITVWYGGVAWRGRNNTARIRSSPYAAVNVASCAIQSGAVESIACTMGCSGVRSYWNNSR